MLEKTPWLVSGAEHSAALARTVAYSANGGREGVASPGDLKVAAQAVPNGSVRVLPGVATLLNSYPGGSGQAYTGRNLSQTNVTISSTGSGSGRSDLLILAIDDPEFSGSAPTDPNDHDYLRFEVISGVSNKQKDLSGLNVPRPAIPLARIDIPKSTGTITSGMIKDLRDLPNPRSERRLYTRQATTTLTLPPTSNGFTNYPRDTIPVEIPSWATHAVIQAEVGSMWLNGSVAKPGVAFGLVRFTLGNVSTQNSWYHHVSIDNGMRFGASVADTIAIPEGLRGRPDIGSAIQLAANSESTGSWVMDTSSFTVLDVEWQERI